MLSTPRGKPQDEPGRPFAQKHMCKKIYQTFLKFATLHMMRLSTFGVTGESSPVMNEAVWNN
jgi:hypothetical protein